MAYSDDEYVQDVSSDEGDSHLRPRGGHIAARSANQNNRAAAWEVSRTWDDLPTNPDGTIRVEALEANKRKRTLKDTTPLQRGIIRHLILILDFSSAMLEKDLRPTRYLLTIRYASEFVTEFFEQNPISQLGIIGMRDGLAVRVSEMSGNPADHISRLQTLREQEPKGHASLQNALDMGRAALFHAPSHGTRELLLILGSLLSSDPGDIHSTITSLVSSHIVCTVIGLAAQVAICRTLVSRTNPSTPASSAYSVALHEQHFRELLMHMTTPPATPNPSTNNGNNTTEDADSSQSSLLMMGFPSRITSPLPTLCACHSKPTRGGYLCSRCSSKVCALPTTCPACGLTLILSTHLARSYHHLFPLRNWVEVPWLHAAAAAAAGDDEQSACFGCLTPFPPLPTKLQQHSSALQRRERERRVIAEEASGVSESGRYECESCNRFFCIDCDVFAHEVVHNCPGCQAREGALGHAGEG